MLGLVRQRSEQFARACAILLGFSIPISVAVDNVLLVLVLCAWLLSLTGEKLAFILRHPVAIAALILLAVLLLGVTYGSRYPGDGWRYVGKYVDLLFIPIFITLFAAERDRLLACRAFAAAMVLTLALSYLRWGGVVPPGGLMDTYPLAAATFKKYLTQNLLMAFAAYLFVYLGLAARPAALRATWLALAVLAAANAALLNPGRSGQLILAALLLYLAYSLWRWKGVLTVAGAMAIAMLLLGFDGRLAQTINDLKAWQPGEPTFTSTGKRLEFYRNSYPIALEHPLIGNGTGSFPRLYAEHTAGSPVTPTDNPHNEYLSIAVQTGVIGLLAMLYLFYCELRFAARLPRFERHMARAVFITMAIGCLFNSLLLDHTEGLFFAWASGVFFGALQPATPRPGTPP